MEQEINANRNGHEIQDKLTVYCWLQKQLLYYLYIKTHAILNITQRTNYINFYKSKGFDYYLDTG